MRSVRSHLTPCRRGFWRRTSLRKIAAGRHGGADGDEFRRLRLRCSDRAPGPDSARLSSVPTLAGSKDESDVCTASKSMMRPTASAANTMNSTTSSAADPATTNTFRPPADAVAPFVVLASLSASCKSHDQEKSHHPIRCKSAQGVTEPPRSAPTSSATRDRRSSRRKTPDQTQLPSVQPCVRVRRCAARPAGKPTRADHRGQ